MSEAREAVLARIRQALADDAPLPDTPRDYVKRGARPADEIAAMFVDRVIEAGGVVVEAADVRAAIGAALAEHDASRVVVAPDLPAALRPAGVALVEDHGLAPTELDALDAAVTTCAVACSDTGTIALDGGPVRAGAITLVPDLHVCVVTRDQVVETVPELFERLESSARAGQPLFLVSGPVCDLRHRVRARRGVHGPRTLVVVPRVLTAAVHCCLHGV